MGLKDLFAAHAEEPQEAAKSCSINVSGMRCNACEKLVSTALEDRGATNVVANHETGIVTFDGELPQGVIAEAIAEAGFQLS